LNLLSERTLKDAANCLRRTSLCWEALLLEKVAKIPKEAVLKYFCFCLS
jgi:hypothetical protein